MAAPAATAAVTAAVSLVPVLIEHAPEIKRLLQKSPQLISKLISKLKSLKTSDKLITKSFEKLNKIDPAVIKKLENVLVSQKSGPDQNETEEAAIRILLTHFTEKLKNNSQGGTACRSLESFECLSMFFFDSVMSSDLYQKLLKINPEHCSLLVSSEDTDFFHFLYFAHCVVKNYIKGKNLPTSCTFCDCGDFHKDRFQIFLYKNRDGFSHFFNTWFNTDLVQTLKLFEALKPVCSPFDGTFGWDLNLMMLNKLKKVNNNPADTFVQYHGIMYKYETTDSLVLKAMSILDTYHNTNIDNYAFIYSVKQVFSPEHWCGIFIDFKSRIFYFYNSLANPKQINMAFFNILNFLCELFNNKKFIFVTNEKKQQESSKLCGMYVYHFILKMSVVNFTERKNLFDNEFNNSTKLSDEILPTLLPNYLNIPSCNSQSMMNYFFTSLDPILFS